jgi:NAD(P)-dependent dehydrogenase (short-subunit alcohol dehydrogenase family)
VVGVRETTYVSIRFDEHHWALILGGSSGFGLATAHKLARHGMNIAVVHRDRKGAMGPIEAEFETLKKTGVGFLSFNLDALSSEGRKTVLDALVERLGAAGKVRLMLHSIAFGNLKLLGPTPSDYGASQKRARARLAAELGIDEERLGSAVKAALQKSEKPEDTDALSALAEPPAYDNDAFLEDEDFQRTVYSMGTSLSSWTQDLHLRKLFAADARDLGMTSEGNEIAWRGYAAVSAAKVALESVSRSIALELAPYGIRSNIVQAGVTDTPALRLIPGSAKMKAAARQRNPFGRLTTPAEVADVICLLATDEARWINGALIRVDGGEAISG